MSFTPFNEKHLQITIVLCGKFKSTTINLPKTVKETQLHQIVEKENKIRNVKEEN